jgi:hypothetical protein
MNLHPEGEKPIPAITSASQGPFGHVVIVLITANGATVSFFYLISASHLVLMDANNSSGAVNPYPAITISRQ